MFDVNEYLLFLKLIEQHLCQELPKISTIISLPLNSLKRNRVTDNLLHLLSLFLRNRNQR